MFLREEVIENLAHEILVRNQKKFKVSYDDVQSNSLDYLSVLKFCLFTAGMKKVKKKLNELVWACAWCPSYKKKSLQKGQDYTHGICLFHKKEFIVSFLKNPIIKTHI